MRKVATALIWICYHPVLGNLYVSYLRRSGQGYRSEELAFKCLSTIKCRSCVYHLFSLASRVIMWMYILSHDEAARVLFISQQTFFLLCFVLAIGILLDVVSFQQCARTDVVVETLRTPTRFHEFVYSCH